MSDLYSMVGDAMSRKALMEGPHGPQRQLFAEAKAVALRCHAKDLSRDLQEGWRRDDAARSLDKAETREEIWRALHWWWTETKPAPR
ncbi:hypothetical protein EWE75_23965 [Sphingomonas populi]|uniref:Uncharacterized protein n=1 Tax=Sphingomonas populi TaxID=2484750 RepID=A0A4Q6XGJ8_9SPHN|nr:hypothetical protein [Sphingomonas populi]RZF59040.1 hypothetical protein EWE75_23965 [Sphingomonas populi]